MKNISTKLRWLKSAVLTRLREQHPANFFKTKSWNDARKLHVVTFYTEGPPFDKGLDLKAPAEHLRSLVSPHVDSFTAFCPRTIRDLPGAERICKEYPGAPLPRNKNAEFLGYFDFKPFVMLHVLAQVPAGDLVLFHEANVSKYESYTDQGFPIWRDLCKTLLDQLGIDVFVPFEHPSLKTYMHVKMHTIRRTLPAPALVRACGERPLINPSRILVRKTALAEDFLRAWLELANQPDLVGPHPNDNPHPGFKWNCADQDALNVLVCSWVLAHKKLPADFPRYYLATASSNRRASRKCRGSLGSRRRQPQRTEDALHFSEELSPDRFRIQYGAGESVRKTQSAPGRPVRRVQSPVAGVRLRRSQRVMAHPNISKPSANTVPGPIHRRSFAPLKPR